MYYYNEKTTKNNAWASVQSLLNHKLAPWIVCGTIFVGGVVLIKKFFPREEETVENGSEPLNKPLVTVQSKQNEPFVEANSTVNEPFADDEYEQLETVNSTVQAEDDMEKERIRSVMSELGRRSGEARRRKKLMEVEE